MVNKNGSPAFRFQSERECLRLPWSSVRIERCDLSPWRNRATTNCSSFCREQVALLTKEASNLYIRNVYQPL